MILTKEDYNSINNNQFKKQKCWCCDKEFYYSLNSTPLTVHPIGKQIGYNVTCPYCNRNFFAN